MAQEASHADSIRFEKELARSNEVRMAQDFDAAAQILAQALKIAERLPKKSRDGQPYTRYQAEAIANSMLAPVLLTLKKVDDSLRCSRRAIELLNTDNSGKWFAVNRRVDYCGNAVSKMLRQCRGQALLNEGVALHYQDRLPEAIRAYRKGAKYMDPSDTNLPALKYNLATAKTDFARTKKKGIRRFWK